MVVYSSPYADSFDPIPQKTQKIWDAVEVLDIINPDRGCLTCVGYAPSCRRRCRNPINAGNRATAFRLLDRIAYSKPQSPDTRKLLHELAKCALCVRYHQGQAHDVVAQWERKIAAMSPEPKVKTEPFDDEWEFDDELSELLKKLAKIRAERERQAQEKEEKARRATEERGRRDRQRREQQEKEDKAQRAREAEGQRERERKRREEQERQNAQRETKRWHERWNTYISRWDEFSSEFPRPRIIRF